MYNVKREKIEVILPMCLCGTTVFIKTRIETMHTITESIECPKCHRIVDVQTINKGKVLSEKKEEKRPKRNSGNL